MNKTLIVLALTLGSAPGLKAQHGHQPAPAPAPANSDSAFRGVQQRGAQVMGVDQYTSQHTFASLADGGSITLVRQDAADTAAISQIRQHMREIAAQFARGDFNAPFIVHAQHVPGTAVMAARREQIRYEVRDVARGAELRLLTTDAAAIAAIHEFMAFQRMDHRAHH